MTDQDWQSAGARRDIFFSARYLSAEARVMGLMMESSLWYQSELYAHFEPSQV